MPEIVVEINEKTLELLEKKGVNKNELKEHLKKNAEAFAKFEIPRIRRQ